MKPVHDLHRLGVVILNQAPDPVGAITDEDHFRGPISLSLQAGRPQQGRKVVCPRNFTKVLHLFGLQGLMTEGRFLAVARTLPSGAGRW